MTCVHFDVAQAQFRRRTSHVPYQNTFSLRGCSKQQALPYPETLPCLLEICRKKLIWILYHCQITMYYLVRHMRGGAPELGLRFARKLASGVASVSRHFSPKSKKKKKKKKKILQTCGTETLAIRELEQVFASFDHSTQVDPSSFQYCFLCLVAMTALKWLMPKLAFLNLRWLVTLFGHDLRVLAMTCVHLNRAQICTQVIASF